MIATLTEANRILILSGLGVVLVWIIPSFFVALRADGDGFPFIWFLLVALFLTWPVALAITLVFGGRSPLVKGQQQHHLSDSHTFVQSSR
jgi:hypothetical protein